VAAALGLQRAGRAARPALLTRPVPASGAGQPRERVKT
jgi:hypothetical protein